MAALVPFRALRPTPDTAPAVAAVPYDVVDTREARALAEGNPLSFLHVSRAEIDLPDDVLPHADEVYAKAARSLQSLRERAPLVVEDAPSLYVYKLRMGAHVQTGVAGCFSVTEYDEGLVKKHERTRPDKEDDRTRHIIELHAQTGPVFLTHRSHPVVDAVVEEVSATPPLFDFPAADGVHHTIWRVDARRTRALVDAFEAIPALYIADGHHRAASASRAKRHFGAGGAAGEWDTFLAVAFPEPQVQVLAYNRVVRDLAGHTPASFLAALRACVTVGEGVPLPARRGEVSMFLDGTWHSIALGSSPTSMPAADRLDVSRLHALVLAPLLGVGDPRTDTRIDFVGGGRGAAELEHRVSSGRAAVAFSMFPVGVDDLMAISDLGGIMPPKSTWFEPKLRDGLLSHLI